MFQPKLFDAPQIDDAPQVVIGHEGVITYDRYFLDPWTADRLFSKLKSDIEWKQEQLRMYGRQIPFPRLTAWYGDPGASYEYSGIRNEPLPWTPALCELRDRLYTALRIKFNSVLLNLYRSGSDSLSWHADDEEELGPTPVIASISLGATRRFQLKSKASGETVNLLLEHGSLLIMSGSTQTHWKHQVPKDGKVTDARINLTFRLIDARGDRPATIPTSRSTRTRKTR